jgi:restriction system protein
LEQERLRAAAARREAAEIRAREVQERRNARLRQQAHLQGRAHEVDDLNQELEEQLKSLETVLAAGLASAKAVDFKSLKKNAVLPAFDPQGRDQVAPEPMSVSFQPKPPGFFAKLMPGSDERHQRRVLEAKRTFDSKHAEWVDYEQKRTAWLSDTRGRHDTACALIQKQTDAQNSEVDAFEAAHSNGDPDALNHYFSIVLERDALPEGFPTTARVAYSKESRQLVVERELPLVEIIPTVLAYRYVKTNDSITSSTRPALQIRELYVQTVARLALRTVNLLFISDTPNSVDTVVLNCFVDTNSPETGQRVTPCLLTVRTTRDVFTAHDLKKVDAIACLKHLNAELSPKPHELRAVRPIVSFSMVDPRFVDKPDILAQLDQRPNLALLKPAEFEALITNLFEKMGLETRLTQASRDGGVDCVAWDMREVVGGKVIIQAKRYKNTVGVSAVRDLYGTVLNEGATKGILVTTSGYGTASAVFADKKPLRLIHGGELLYLLEHHTGVKAKIEFPQEWVDPRPDIVEADIPVSTTKPSLDVKSDTSVISIQTDSRPAAGITDRPSETGNSSS